MPKKRTAKARTLKQRAEAIIANSRRYDLDTPEWLREPSRQCTAVKMLSIDTLYALDLAQQCAPDDLDTRGRDDLMELICGIAAIDNQMYRQEVAYQAIRAIYQLNNEHGEEINRWMNRLYETR
jgi:septum formation topological specificity factor MinE